VVARIALPQRLFLIAFPGVPDAMSDMRRSYARVLIVWVITLLALYAFQEYFS
jgi:hypothetical protein